MSSDFPYADRFAVNRTLPEHGPTRARRSSTSCATMAKEEDAFWETGKCSGTMYCGDHEHYDFMNEAFGLFAHVNVLQRDMCPSADQVRGRDHRHGARPVPRRRGHRHRARRARHHRRHRQHPPRRARLPRARRPRRGASRRPNFIKPETGAPRVRQGAATCSASSCARRRSTPRPRTVDVGWVADHIDDQTDRHRRARPATTATAPSTRSRSSSDARARARRRPARRRLPRRLHPPVRRGARLRHPGLRLPRARRHEHLGRHPQVRLRVQGHVGRCCSATRRCATASTSSSPTGPAASTARPASRAPAPAGCSPRRGRRWCSSAARATCGYAKEIFETADAMQDAVRVAPRAADHRATPTFCFSFTSDEFDIYHVNDFMRTEGWRFNGQQYPNAHPHGRHPPADPARRGRGVRHRPRRGRRATPSEHKDEAPISRRDLRRRRRRA